MESTSILIATHVDEEHELVIYENRPDKLLPE